MHAWTRFHVFTFVVPGEFLGFPRKQLDSLFAAFLIILTLVGMVLSGKDKSAQLESEIEGLMRKSQKPSVTEGFSIKLLTYILGTPDEIANLLENAEKRTLWDPEVEQATKVGKDSISLRYSTYTETK